MYIPPKHYLQNTQKDCFKHKLYNITSVPIILQDPLTGLKL